MYMYLVKDFFLYHFEIIVRHHHEINKAEKGGEKKNVGDERNG